MEWLKRTAHFLKFLWSLLTLLVKDTVFYCFMSTKKKSITEEVVLITGGGRGIGKSVALKLATHHPKHIILWGRTESTLEQAVKEIRDLKVNCSYMVCDVSSKEEIYAMAKEVKAKFGDVTMLINNAGVVYPSSIIEGEQRLTELTLKTNVLAHFWTVRSFLPSMIEHKHGHIVSISSVLGMTGLNGVSDYCTSKFAATGFAEALQDELANDGLSESIVLTTIYPYHVDNSMFAGISTRFPKLFPPINEDYLADKIIEAILTNRSKVLVPKLMYLIALFYAIAPVAAITTIMKFLRVHKAIELYHEHRMRSSSVHN